MSLTSMELRVSATSSALLDKLARQALRGDKVLVSMWQLSCGSHHLAVIMRQSSCGSHHEAVIVWQSACGSYHVTVCMWQSACGSHNVVVLMCQSSCGSHHVLPPSAAAMSRSLALRAGAGWPLCPCRPAVHHLL